MASSKTKSPKRTNDPILNDIQDIVDQHRLVDPDLKDIAALSKKITWYVGQLAAEAQTRGVRIALQVKREIEANR